MRACVIFDTRYGNTEKIAESLGTGLEEAGIQTVCINVKGVAVDSLKQYDLICVGGPTQYRTASKAIQDFLCSLKEVKLSGKLAFAFDTRRDSFLAGSAARFIEERLRRFGLKLIRPRLSAIILDSELEEKKRESESKDEWKERRRRTVRLQEGMESEFERIGNEIGRTVAVMSTGTVS
jgi:flavodoxin